MLTLSRSLFAVSLALSVISHGAPQLPEIAPDPESRLPVMGKYLSQGGDFYVCLSTGQWAANLDQAVAKIMKMVKVVLPEVEQENLQLISYFLTAFLRDSGVREFAGVGASSVAMAEDMHQNRLFLQHPVGPPKGFLWEAFTAENRPFDWLQRLPANTVYARWAMVRPEPVWNWLKQVIDGCGRPDIVRGFHEGLEKGRKEEGVELDRWFASVTGGVGLVATLDPKRMIQLSTGGDQPIAFPAFAGALVVEVKDDTLFEFAERMIKKEGGEAKRIDKDGVRSYVFPEVEVAESGFFIQPSISRFGPYLVLSSSHELLASLAAGKGGLSGVPHFQRCQQAMPKQGFGFSYLSPVAVETVANALFAALATDEPEAAEMLRAAYRPFRGIYSWSVALRTPDGVAYVANQRFGTGQLLLSHHPTLQNTPILAGLLLPALSQARGKARRISDASNLKQIGTGLIMYCMDYGDKFPDDLGMLMEMGYIRGGEVYVSPTSDTVPPTTAEELRAGRCDYLLRQGPDRGKLSCRAPHRLHQARLAQEGPCECPLR